MTVAFSVVRYVNMKHIESIEYTDELIEIGEQVTDFLPAMQQLADVGEVVLVTIPLSGSALAYVRRVAEHRGISFRKAIANLLTEFAEQRP